MIVFTAQEKYECAKREVEQRLRVYSRKVAEKKMTAAFADRQIALMQAIRDDLEILARQERLI